MKTPAQILAARGIDIKLAARKFLANLKRQRQHPGIRHFPGKANEALSITIKGTPHKYSRALAAKDKDLPLADYIARFDELNRLKSVTYE